MTKRIGKFTKIWVEGFNLTTLLTEVSIATTHDTAEIGGFTQDKHYLNARGDGEILISGFLSDATGETHDALKSLASGGTASIVTVVLGQNIAPVLGDIAASMSAVQLTYVANPDLTAAVAVNASFKPGVNQVPDWGILLADAAITANGNTASVDNGAGTTDGGTGYLHITSLSAGDTITVTIEDSTDDAAWATLLTFTLDGTVLDGERITVTGTVDRYVRAEYTVTGASISFPIAVTFKRN